MERVDANLVPFAQNNPSGYRFAFGTDTATDDINANYNDNIKKGWGTTPNEFPEVEDFNAMVYTIGYLLSYLYHMGIAEWNDKQKYRQHSRVIGSDGIIYKAKTGTDISPNVNNNPTTDSINWEIDIQLDINSLTAKTTPIDTDNLVVQEVGGLLKKLSWENVKATLKTYFDTLYQSVSKIAYNTTTSSYIANTLSSGAIIERGNNANGDYVKYADGTMNTFGKITVASNNNNGTAYTFPATFIATPTVQAQANRISSAGLSGSIVTEHRDATITLVYVKGVLHGATTITDVTSLEIEVTAIGKWK